MIRVLRGPTFWLMLVLILTPLAFALGPAVETKYFPVFRQFKLVSIERIEPGLSRVVVSFDKVRECEPAGFAWYQGARHGNQFSEIAVRTVTMGNTVGRPVGQQLSAPFEVAANPEDLGNIFVNVFSRCPFQPWVTKSEVYP